MQEFSERWLQDHAEKQLAPKTVFAYRELLKGRIYPALGHIVMQKLQPVNLINFYSNLEESGIRLDTKYTATPLLVKTIKGYGKRKGITEFSKASGITVTTISGLCNGRNTSKAIVERISAFVKADRRKLFKPCGTDKVLASNTIAHYHRLLSSILSTAVQWQVIESNPAERVKAPRIEKKESGHYNEDQVEMMLEAVENENIRLKTIVYSVIFMGMRLGELSGLEWKDIDFQKNTINIVRASQYINDKTKKTDQHINTTDPKNQSSKRKIVISQEAVIVLKQYRKWQLEERIHLGDAWQRKEKEVHGIDYDNDRLFTKWDGSPIFPDTPSRWFKKFRDKHGLPPLTFHQLRHTNASLMIGQGIDVATVGKRLGHSTPATTMKIYAHALQRPDQAAADKLDELFKKKEKPITRQA